MSNSFKKYFKDMISSNGKKPKVKTLKISPNRKNVKQLLTSKIDLSSHYLDVENKLDLLESNRKVKHKIVGHVNIHEKAKRYAGFHHIDESQAENKVYHGIVNK